MSSPSATNTNDTTTTEAKTKPSSASASWPATHHGTARPATHTPETPRAPQTKHPESDKPAETGTFIGSGFTGSDYDATGHLKPEMPATETQDPEPYGDEWFDAAPEY